MSRVDSRTAGRGRALCGEAGVSVFLLALSLSGSPSLLPAPLQKAHRGDNHILMVIKKKNGVCVSQRDITQETRQWLNRDK